jgi:peptidoglycan/xylan/chitin deacetylase (PgdA/CDA1 family)
VGLALGILAGVLAAIVVYLFLVEPLSALRWLERITPNIVYRTRTDLPLVGLSFDDGPHAKFTPRVLEVLEQNDAKATFFLIGERALREPKLVARIREAGHEIGNHYFRDGTILGHSDVKFLAKLEGTERALRLGEQPLLFRPPGGVAWPRQLRLVRERGYLCVLGCAYPHDPMRPPVWYMRWLIRKNLAPGTIVILHDGIKDASRSIEVLPQILEEGKKRGFKFVSIGKLIEAGKAVARDKQ